MHFAAQPGRQFAANHELALEARRKFIAFGEAGRQIIAIFVFAIPVVDIVAIVIAVVAAVIAVFIVMIFVMAMAVSMPLAVALSAGRAAGQRDCRAHAQNPPPTHLHNASWNSLSG